MTIGAAVDNAAETSGDLNKEAWDKYNALRLAILVDHTTGGLHTALSSSLISDTDDTDDLGSATKEWRSLYIDGVATIDSLVADTADINGGTIDGVSLTDITMSLGSDADGDVYYRTSNKLTRLAKGTATHVLTMNAGATAPEWAAGGAGDITGPGSSTDNAIARWSGTGGDTLQNSGITISDGNALTIGSGHTLDVSAGTLTLAANQISGDKVEGGTVAAITITALTIGTSLKLEGGTYDTTIQPGTPTASVTYVWPLADGTSGQVLQTNASGVLSWATAAGAGDVTAAANLTDNAIVRGDGGAKGVQTSGLTIDDSNNLTLPGNLDMSGGNYDILINSANGLEIKYGATQYFHFDPFTGKNYCPQILNVTATLDLDANLDMSSVAPDIKIIDNNAAALEIKEATTAYLTFVTTDAGEKITLGKKLEAGAVEIEGSAFDINGGNIDNTVVGNGNPSTGSFTTLSLRSVGELRFFDDGNYVGFEAPALDANQIWVLPTADGAANTVLKTDGAGNLGWVSAPGADTALSNLASVTINTSLISDTDITDDLGTAVKRWKDIYAATIGTGDTATDTLLLRARDVDGASWTTFITLTAANTPTCDLASGVTIGTAYIYRAGGTDIPLTDGGTGASTAADARTALGLVIGTNVLAQQTIGIADDNLLEVDDADAAATNYARFTANGLEGRTAANVLSDISALANIVEDTTPQLGGELDCQAHTIGFTQQTATGDATTTIDWTAGNKFYFTFGAANETFTFDPAPTHECNLLLVLKQDGTGSRTATWPVSVMWPGGTAPTLSTGANAVDIVVFYWDGTNYHGLFNFNFSVPA